MRRVTTGVYSDFRGIGWDDVDAPLAWVVYLKNPDIQWIFGMRADIRTHYPVLPAVGVRWKIQRSVDVECRDAQAAPRI